jgi:hypothetical protein
MESTVLSSFYSFIQEKKDVSTDLPQGLTSQKTSYFLLSYITNYDYSTFKTGSL